MNEVLDILTGPLLLPVTIALAGGTLAYLLSRWSPPICRLIGVVTAIGTLLAAVAAAGTPEKTFHQVWTEVLAGRFVLSLDLAATTLGMVVVIGSAAFAVLIAVYSLRAMAGEYWEGKFYAYLCWSLAGACLVGLAGNLLVLLVGWELVTLMLFLMVNQGRGDAKSGAAKAYGVLGFADACLLLAIALLVAAKGGSDNLSLSRGPVDAGSFGPTGYVIYVLVLIASLAKAGAVPLHTWIPSVAEGAPAPVLAWLPAAVDKLLGIYLLSVLTLRMFRPDGSMQTVMMVVGGVTILAGVLMAMMQHNLKRLLSFHAVSQVGYMVLGIGTGTTIGVVGGLFHMVNNVIYKSGLFLMSGAVSRASGSDELQDMGGLARVLPVTFISALVASAAISGVPPLNGFASKWLVYQATLQVPNHGLAVALLVAAVFGSALTLASFVKVMYSAFLSPAPRAPQATGPRARESLVMAAPMVVLAAACVLLGVLPGILVSEVLLPAVSHADTSGLFPRADVWVGVSTGPLGLWQPTQATWLIFIGLLLGGLLLWIAAGRQKVRVVRPFLAGEVPAAGDDRFRVPGTHFYETIARLPLIGPLLAHGQGGAMDLYYWSSKHGGTLVDLLRAQHTGLLSLYVAWCLVGLTVTLVYLLLSVGI